MNKYQFRIWLLHEKKMIKSSSDDYALMLNGRIIYNSSYQHFPDSKTIYSEKIFYSESDQLVSAIIMMKIDVLPFINAYEGDILKIGHLYDELIFKDGTFYWKGRYIGHSYWFNGKMAAFEVMGNKYENPELLELIK